MAKRSKRSDRTVFTPRLSTTDLAATGEKLTYWKQILPEDVVRYRDKDGSVQIINMDSAYHKDLIAEFRDPSASRPRFQLASPNNGHGRDWDPERQRADVLDMATYDELPEDVKAEIGEKPGLYAKMRFFSKKAARAVENMPDLGVSARVRENFPRADGKLVKRAVIHVLGTLDPVITGMAPWKAVDLSYDPDNGYVLDLSEAHYEGDDMAKNKNAEAKVPTDDEIDAMTDEELDKFLLAAAKDLGYAPAEDDEDDEDNDEPVDKIDEEQDVDEHEEKPVTASLSNRQRKAIDLANSQAAEARSRAMEALKRQATAEFKGYRAEQTALGVPPWVIDLAAPVLGRPDEMVVDLSNTDDDDVNISAIVRKLVEGYKDTIDMSAEAGHSGSFDLANDGEDPDQENLDAWDEQYPNE